MKIALINNYDMRGIAISREQEGLNAPAQHLWGLIGLPEHGIEVDIIEFKQFSFFKKLSDKLKILGDLDQQWKLLVSQHRYDAVYSAHHLTTLLLAALRLVGILRIPIIAIAYQAPRSRSLVWTWFVRIFMGGNDRILCLSEALLEDLAAFGIPRRKLSVIGWGVDLPLYPTGRTDIPPAERFVFSSGKSYRDYPTLLSAIGDHALTICGAGKTVWTNGLSLPPQNVNIIQTMVHWTEFIEIYQQSYVVAIVLEENRDRFKNAIGFTVLSEALAVGKAIVMTRNDYVGIDIEAEGIGLWVEVGDSIGWRKALDYLMDHPEIAQEMGRKARLLAERQYNLEQFTDQLATSLWDLCKTKTRPQRQRTQTLSPTAKRA
jgi:glycosyltransferase involved in cell wall biosynthesis